MYLKMLTQDLTMHYKNGLFSKIFLIKCIKNALLFERKENLNSWQSVVCQSGLI